MHPRRPDRGGHRQARRAQPLSAEHIGLTGPTPFGVYLHIPFCRRRCDYCAFATWTDRSHLEHRYLDACRTHVRRAVDDGTLGAASSVFVGGGTPSLVDPEALMGVVAEIPRRPDAEVTVECNPDDASPALLAAYVAGGVNRVSFGVQSMVPRVLRALGRTHDPGNVSAAVSAARAAGIRSINVDLIYGAAGETIDEWMSTLDEAVALEPDHISAYALTVEPGTPLAGDPTRHPDDDDQADKYVLADEHLAAAGYPWYELSNFARPGHECRHNLLYWRQGDYLGVGCAAHSHRDGRRSWNVRTPERYIDRIESGLDPEAASEQLSEHDRTLEGLQLAIRTSDGVPVAAAPGGGDLSSFLTQRDGRAVLTREGRLVANEVAVRLRLV